MWCKLQCSWNWLVAKLLFDIKNCPYRLCSCNTEVKKKKSGKK